MDKMTIPEMAALSQAKADLEAIRQHYQSVRDAVRELRARHMPHQEAAYWVGVAQSFSKQAHDDLQTLADAVFRIELYVRDPLKEDAP